MNAIQNIKSSVGNESQASLGIVALVGAGPGAADLLTVRAVRALEDADAVYYDSLVDKTVLDLIPAQTKRVFVGKRKGYSAMPQQQIHNSMREDAVTGLNVVRLKGGDPFIFGRGGEELFDLRAQGIEVKVIPGLTTALAAAAEHGIPLTHRNVATSVTFATGHTLDHDIPDFAGFDPTSQTLVIYMGMSNAEKISQALQAKGVIQTVPVAVIERATLPGQRLIKTSLEKMSADIAHHKIVTPALLIIGHVTGLGAPQSESLSLQDSVSHSPTPPEKFAWVHHPMG